MNLIRGFCLIEIIFHFFLLLAMLNHVFAIGLSDDISQRTSETSSGSLIESGNSATIFHLTATDIGSSWHEKHRKNSNFVRQSHRKHRTERRHFGQNKKNVTRHKQDEGEHKFCLLCHPPPVPKAMKTPNSFHHGNAFFAFHKVKLDAATDPLTHQPYHKTVLAISASKIEEPLGKVDPSLEETHAESPLESSSSYGLSQENLGKKALDYLLWLGDKSSSRDSGLPKHHRSHRGRHFHDSLSSFTEQLDFLQKWLNRIDRHHSRKFSVNKWKNSVQDLQLLDFEHDQT